LDDFLSERRNMMSSNSKFEKLFQPIKIGQMELKNRIVMPPMATLYCTKDGYVSQRLKDYYEERAKGGVGLITVGAAFVHPRGKAFPGLDISDDQFIPGMGELVQAIQKHSAKVAIELCHSGRTVKSEVSGMQPVAPSPIPASPGGEVPKELPTEEIAEIVAYYAQAAQRAKKAGADIVEIDSGGGSLIGQFLSRACNKRRDAYGGNLRNRARFMVDVITAVREAVGAGYPIECKITGTQYGIENGITLEQARETALIAQDAGADVLCAGSGGSLPGVLSGDIPPVPTFVELAEAIKKVVTVPVIAMGRIDPELGERALEEGKADLIAMGRALIADPELPNKVASGRLDDITPCIVCMECLDRVFSNTPLECAVNARVGREAEYTIEPAQRPKKVCVIGGGPAGMEAARVAALRGHRVTLYEKDSRLGGQLIQAAIPPHKDRIIPLTRYLEAQSKKLSVKVELGKEVTQALLDEVKPDAVILAAGATPIIPKIPGARGDNTVTALDVLTERKKVGESVVVVGGGMVGCETAEFLAERGKKVTILEMLDEIGSDIGPILRSGVLARLKNAGVRMEADVKVVEMSEKGVRGVRDNVSEFFSGDTVVLAVGMRSENKLARSLEGKVKEFHLIGDCLKPGRIKEAIADGFRIGREI
jgi:2,4-dienoyl-CoA reductase-like NADH-dependent reductase (Old Yellow Enzyme family)/thioredoxin reductase